MIGSPPKTKRPSCLWLSASQVTGVIRLFGVDQARPILDQGKIETGNHGSPHEI